MEQKKCNFNKNKKNHGRSPYGTWKCYYCGLVFETRRQLEKHKRQFHPIQKGSSWNKGLTKTDPRIKNYVSTIQTKIKNGEIIPHMRGKHMPDERKQKTSKSMIKFRRSLKSVTRNPFGFIPTYNPHSIQYFEQLSKEMNWNLQHAENGGEYMVCGYFLDAYDKEKNIVVEYDEARHYKDVENNILIDKDIECQNVIIEQLHCQFYRYNEKMNILWKVI